MQIYSVIQHLDWCCPGMLIAVDEEGYILWVQQNPKNGLTRVYADEYEEREKFDPSNYKSVRLVR